MIVCARKGSFILRRRRHRERRLQPSNNPRRNTTPSQSRDMPDRMKRDPMNDNYVYRDAPARVASAAGVKGVLVRTIGGPMVFRVYREGHEFTD